MKGKHLNTVIPAASNLPRLAGILCMTPGDQAHEEELGIGFKSHGLPAQAAVPKDVGGIPTVLR